MGIGLWYMSNQHCCFVVVVDFALISLNAFSTSWVSRKNGGASGVDNKNIFELSLRK
jgi:hypothetical protein